MINYIIDEVKEACKKDFYGDNEKLQAAYDLIKDNIKNFKNDISNMENNGLSKNSIVQNLADFISSEVDKKFAKKEFFDELIKEDYINFPDITFKNPKYYELKYSKSGKGPGAFGHTKQNKYLNFFYDSIKYDYPLKGILNTIKASNKGINIIYTGESFEDEDGYHFLTEGDLDEIIVSGYEYTK